MTGKQRIVEAFLRRLAAVVGEDVPVNPSGQIRLKEPGDRRTVLRDEGGRDAPRYAPIEGTKVYIMHLRVETYVAVDADTDAEDVLEAANDRVLHAFDADPTLGGLLYGWQNEQDVSPHFEGLEEGDYESVPFVTEGSSSGAACSQEFLLHYAPDPDRPGRLLTQE